MSQKEPCLSCGIIIDPFITCECGLTQILLYASGQYEWHKTLGFFEIIWDKENGIIKNAVRQKGQTYFRWFRGENPLPFSVTEEQLRIFLTFG